MASKWGNIGDYPEHLNPFNDSYRSGLPTKKRSNSISETFKGIRNTLRKSFRGKKPEKFNPSPVVLRSHQTSNASSRYTLPTEYPFRSSPVALPRSRFRERLAKSNVPLNEETQLSVPEVSVEKLEEKKVKKKKAPAPPPRTSSVPEELDTKTLRVTETTVSKWSLTSGETNSNYTTEYNSEDDTEITETTLQIQEMLQQLTLDMEKLTHDDSNNNIVECAEVKMQVESTDIPDVVVSCVNEENDNEKISDVNSNSELTKDVTPPENESVTKKILMFEQNGKGAEDLKMIDDDTDSPVPKLRKHKLTKDNLLGNNLKE